MAGAGARVGSDAKQAWQNSQSSTEIRMECARKSAFESVPSLSSHRRKTRAHVESHLTCPDPTISYFEDVNSTSANGPRQCSFCVLIPISAPKPNSPPSVKRVEAFQYTAAESTPRRNFRAFASSRVTMDSEFLVE